MKGVVLASLLLTAPAAFACDIAMVVQDTGFDLTGWFETDVITGPGAFAVTADTFDEYHEQIIRKLYRELTTPISELR